MINARLIDFVRTRRGQVALSIGAAACTILAGIGLMTSSGYLIAWAAQRPPILDLMLVIVAVRFFALSRAAFRYLERLVSHDLTFRWLMTLRVQLYRILAPLLPGLLLRRSSGDLLGRMVADVDTLQNLYLRVVAPACTAAVVVLVTVAALHAFSPLLAWTAFLFLALNGIGVPWYITRRARGLGAAQIHARAALTSDLVEHVQGMNDVLMFGQADVARARIDAHNTRLAELQSKQAVLTGLQDALSHGCAHLGMWSVLAVSIPLVTSGRLDGVFLALLALGVLTSFEAAQSLGTAFQFHEQTRAAEDRLNELEREPSPISIPDEPAKLVAWDIRVERVSFAYESEPALTDLRFTLAPGQRIGVIGPSGAGKSTLAHLLLRFRDPTAGTIYIGGKDLLTIPQETVLQHIAVVPQHTHLFNDTIRDNVRLAKPAAQDDELWHALDQARLADFVRSLPDGLDTLVGEQGARLSGGERQRLAIARACLKNAPLMLLDEPTSHLDARTEGDIIDTLFRVTKGRSALWITHRLIRLEELDTLLVLANGRIHERGSHDQLLANNDYYARMLRQQNQILDT